MVDNEAIQEILDESPDDVTMEEVTRAIEPLVGRYKIHLGLHHSAKDESLPHEEVKLIVRGWLQELGQSTKGRKPMTIKEEIIKLMQDLPDEAPAEETIGEAIDRLYLLYRVERGERQINEGKGIPHEEVRQRIAEWRK